MDKAETLAPDISNILSEALLVDLLSKKKAEVVENVVFEGKKRYYIEDLTERDYVLENTTPYQINILDNSIEAHAWGTMIVETTRLLLRMFPEKKKNLPNFKCEWSRAIIFSIEAKQNFKQVHEDLYVNINHTALHSCWLIQDLLDHFEINKQEVYLLIHRPCSAEPKKVKEYIENRFKSGFIEFVKIKYQRTQEYGEKVVYLTGKYLNPILKTVSKSYDNLFLFDDNPTLYNYVKKVRERLALTKLEDKHKKVLNKYLDYLVAYYKE